METINLLHNFPLKGCPHCGNVPRLSKTIGEHTQYVSISCDPCDTEMKETYGKDSSLGMVAEIIIDRWNRRQ